MPSIDKRTERTRKYDSSNHSTHRREKDDLNAPGQGDERGENGPPSMSEVPGKPSKNRG